jgi:hypothetical protein
MRRRKKNPAERKLNVKWSTEEWSPAIHVLAESERKALGLIIEPFTFSRPKPRRRRQGSILWMRGGMRVTWR